MDDLTAWLTIAGVTTACVTGILYAVTAVLRDEQRQRELNERVLELREIYRQRLREIAQKSEAYMPEAMQIQADGEVDIVEDQPTPPARKAA